MISPRYPASTVPGELTIVMPCLVASPRAEPRRRRTPRAGRSARPCRRGRAARARADSLSGGEVGAGVTGMGVGRNLGRDNEDVHGFGHSTRVMQMSAGDGAPLARTRDVSRAASPSLWVLVSAAVVAPMAALVLAPIDTTLALVVGTACSECSSWRFLVGVSPSSPWRTGCCAPAVPDPVDRCWGAAALAGRQPPRAWSATGREGVAPHPRRNRPSRHRAAD